ncbi:hypothetical protein HNV12_07600 [Methanococcoides sp. SA1]|nr:hypothetical protein [Methanococcoides sp. SA1]
MDLNNSKTIVLLITMCILAAIAGAATSQIIMDNNGSNRLIEEELQISAALVDDDMLFLINTLESANPNDVFISDDKIVLRGMVINEFDSVYFNGSSRFGGAEITELGGNINFIVHDGDIKYSQDLTDYYVSNSITEELSIPISILNENITSVLMDLNATYNASVEVTNDNYIISGRSAISEFDMNYFMKRLSFSWEQADMNETKIIFNIYDDGTLINSKDYTGFYNVDLFSINSAIGSTINSDGFVVLSYDELGLLVDGDEETVEHFRSVLENKGNVSMEMSEMISMGWAA